MTSSLRRYRPGVAISLGLLSAVVLLQTVRASESEPPSPRDLFTSEAWLALYADFESARGTATWGLLADKAEGLAVWAERALIDSIEDAIHRALSESEAFESHALSVSFSTGDADSDWGPFTKFVLESVAELGCAIEFRAHPSSEGMDDTLDDTHGRAAVRLLGVDPPAVKHWWLEEAGGESPEPTEKRTTRMIGRAELLTVPGEQQDGPFPQGWAWAIQPGASGTLVAVGRIEDLETFLSDDQAPTLASSAIGAVSNGAHLLIYGAVPECLSSDAQTAVTEALPPGPACHFVQGFCKVGREIALGATLGDREVGLRAVLGWKTAEAAQESVRTFQEVITLVKKDLSEKPEVLPSLMSSIRIDSDRTLVSITAAISLEDLEHVLANIESSKPPEPLPGTPMRCPKAPSQ